LFTQLWVTHHASRIMFPVGQTELTLETARQSLTQLMPHAVSRLERIGGGGNSQVYRVETNAGEQFALKVYFRNPADQRDRLATEFGAFSYLWANGFREIPQPLASDPTLGWAIYQFVAGEKIPPGSARDADLLVAADFLGRLRELSRNAESARLGIASEASFAPAIIAQNVQQRLDRLQHADGDGPLYEALHHFLNAEFIPLLENVVRWSQANLEKAGMAFHQELAPVQRTLSPSDFGFHNALRHPSGRIFFLDFEYFGWDDPAKMISDFLLHPAMSLGPEANRKFASAILGRFTDWPGLSARVESVYPLFGLKWCMIFLNEFLPDSLRRRQFAGAAGPDRSAVQMRQLDKSRQMLNRISREYKSFPYHA
jgi:hypothetical protein